VVWRLIFYLSSFRLRRFDMMDMDNEMRVLESEIFMALGAVSMCWDSLDSAGNFDSERCVKIGRELMGQVREVMGVRLEELEEGIRNMEPCAAHEDLKGRMCAITGSTCTTRCRVTRSVNVK
jgi:hypothetical protein